MPLLQVSPDTAAAANTSARYRSQLQAAHAAAQARVRKVCLREPGVISIYDLGQLIAEFESEQIAAGQRLDITQSVTLHGVIRRLQLLIPANR